MPIHDLRNMELPQQIHADVCVIGSGPAGWTVAEELQSTKARIVVLESGSALESGVGMLDPEYEELNQTEDTGIPLSNGRRRTLGGSPEAVGWGNRCAAFDPIDYEQRSWIPLSGWPFGPEVVAPYLDRASRHLGGGPHLHQGPRLPPAPRGATQPDVNEEVLRHAWWYLGRAATGGPVRFGRKFRDGPHSNVRVIVHATATHLNTNDAGTRIESVDVSDLSGRRARVSAGLVVLCAGGIENPRVLLYANKQAQNGLGNHNDLVGRFLMDHPRDYNMAVTFDPECADDIYQFFGPCRLDSGDGPREFIGGLSLSPQLQREEQLLNCAAWPIVEPAESDPIEAFSRVARREWSHLGTAVSAIAKHPGIFTSGLHARLVSKQPARNKCKKVGFYIGSEQLPDPDSRVTLTERTDRLGLPVAKTNWRLNALDLRSQIRLARGIQDEFERLRLPKARLADWVQARSEEGVLLSDGAHPTGTTRMSDDPRQGVVDANCQVHGVDGLYVAGSSVFPTASHANPTLMIVAIAARLADHLKHRMLGRQG